MAIYTELDSNSIQEITAAFNIGPVTRFKVLEGGSQNSNYRIDVSGKSYVLTVCENRPQTNVVELTKLLSHLEAHGFPSSRIIPASNGEGFDFYNDKPVLIKEFLHGEIIEDFDDAMLLKIGASIANLHAVPVPGFLQNRFSYGIEKFDMPDTFAKHPFVVWLAKVKLYIEENISKDLRKGLIHADIFFNNVVVSAEQEPLIMDFEEAGDYYLIFDLGMAIVGLCCNDEGIDRSKIAKLIAGYQSVNPLNAGEIEKLKAFLVYAASVTASWRFRQFNITEPDEQRKDRYRSMQQLADEALAIPDAEFIALLE